MEQVIRNHLNELYNPDPAQRSASLQYILEITEQPVDWASEVWEEFRTMLTSYDNQERAIAVQVLTNLAKNDPERINNDLEQMLLVTKDKNVQIASDSLRSIWKIGVANIKFRERLIDVLGERFKECAEEANATDKRYNIIKCFRNIFDEVEDGRFRNKSMSLITSEEKNPESRKKYSELWSDIIEKSRTKWENVDDVITHYEKKLEGYRKKLDAFYAGNRIKQEELLLKQKIFYAEDFLYYLRKIKTGINKNYIHKSKLPENVPIDLKSKRPDNDLVKIFRKFT